MQVRQWLATGFMAGALAVAALSGNGMVGAAAPVTAVPSGTTQAVSVAPNTTVLIVATTAANQQVTAPANIGQVYSVPGGSELTILAPGAGPSVFILQPGQQQMLPITPGVLVTITTPGPVNAAPTMGTILGPASIPYGGFPYIGPYAPGCFPYGNCPYTGNPYGMPGMLPATGTSAGTGAAAGTTGAQSGSANNPANGSSNPGVGPGQPGAQVGSSATASGGSTSGAATTGGSGTANTNPSGTGGTGATMGNSPGSTNIGAGSSYPSTGSTGSAPLVPGTVGRP